MLRKKLLARLGLLVVGFVAGAVISIILLQGVLHDLDQMNSDAVVLIDGVQELSGSVTALESAPQGEEGAAARAALEGPIQASIHQLGRHPLLSSPGGSASAEMRRVEALMGASLAGTDAGERSRTLTELRSAVLDLGRSARQYVAAEQKSVASRLRWLVIWLTVAALVMVNIASMVLLGTANMILRPVGQLVQLCRDLAEERFDSRVQINQEDEFGELAHAYNAMADELGELEGRKVQAMRQLAVTLNHELLNVISSIDLQLQLVDRKSGSDPAMAMRLRDIHECLGRLATTISSLRNVRRIVLTDYLPGEKMLDLPRSVAADDLERGPEDTGTPGAASGAASGANS